MKTKLPLSCALCFSVLAWSSAWAAESKRTAEYLLTSPQSFRGGEVTLDVSFVRPVHWVSPLPEVSFFHALTVDRIDRRPAGEIMVAVPASQAAAFAKKYGTDFAGRFDMTTLKGTFMAVGATDKNPGGRMWLVDTTGKLQQLIDEKKLQLPEEPPVGGLARQGGFRNRQQHALDN